MNVGGKITKISSVMRKTAPAAMVLMGLFLPQMSAVADAPYMGFRCDPDKFTMIQQPTFSDQKAKYLLEGEITFPTPGYGTNIVREDDDFSTLTYKMNVITPDGDVADIEIPQPLVFDVLADADLATLVIEPGENADVIDFKGIRCERDPGWQP